MSRAYTSDGKRLSSMTHARRFYVCSACRKVVNGNGGKSSHKAWHERANEEVHMRRVWFGVGTAWGPGAELLEAKA